MTVSLKKENKFYSIDTAKGSFFVSLDEKGKLDRLLFPNQKDKSISISKTLTLSVKKIEKTLDRYFSGKTVALPDVNFSNGTLFQQKVWKTLLKIPHGQTRSYSWIAKQVGSPKAVRAVGTACGKNPIPIFIPCHRVLQSSGGLGGFAPGLPWKKYLLNLEQN